jgi:ubiquinol-cytochrome c reductase subunit 8
MAERNIRNTRIKPDPLFLFSLLQSNQSERQDGSRARNPRLKNQVQVRPHLPSPSPSVSSCLILQHSWHIGDWGNPYAAGGRGGKGTVTYSLSSNRLNPMAGCLKKGIPNIVRRAKSQVLYVVPPFVVAYYTMQWAIERYGTDDGQRWKKDVLRVANTTPGMNT